MGAVAFVAMPVLMTGWLWGGQIPAAQQQTSGGAAAQNVSAKAQPGVMLDRSIAVVNGDVLLESDVDEERRFEEVQPYRSIAESTREKIIERLVDRTLILQQAAIQGEDTVSEADLNVQLATLRKDIPACKQYHCETDEGWQKYLADRGFTVE